MVFTQGRLSFGRSFGHQHRIASLTFFSDGDSGNPSHFVQAANTWYNFLDTYIVRFVADGCRKNLPLNGDLMQFSIRSLLTLVAFTALGIAAISVRARPLVAVLSLSTTIWILYAFLACFLKHRKARTYWIGFVVFSFGYFFWMGGPGNREFYSVPGVVTEWLSGPAEIYSEYSRYDAITYPTPVAPWRENQAIRGRVRYSANCIAAIYLGVLGGWIAVQMKGGTEA